MGDNENDTTSLLGASSPHSNYGLIPTSELNFAPSVVEGEVDENKTSPVRRTFLLIAFFEVLTLSILWFLYVRSLPGDTLEENFEEQVVHMKFETSLFDNFLCCFVRFFWTQISYLCMKSKKIYYQAIATLVTSAYTVSKIALFEGDKNLHYLEYAQIILNFIEPWVQSLFLDCRVLPQEKAAERHLEYRRLMSEEGTRNRGASTYYRSIYGSPNGSLVTDIFRTANQAFFDPNMINKLSEDLEKTAKNIYHYKKWKKWNFSDRELVQSIKLTNFNIKEKVFRLDGIIQATPRAIIKELTDNVNSTPIWNPLVEEMHVVESHPESNSDIIYSKMKDIAGGIISARDFVIFRKWHLADEEKDFSYIVANSTDHPNFPPRNGVTRAYQSVNHMFIQPLAGEIKKSHVTILLAIDIQGWIPSNITEKGTKDSMRTFFESFKKQIQSYSLPVRPINAHLAV